jgi:hypothetical protein
MERISCQLIRKEKPMDPLFFVGMIAEAVFLLVIFMIVLKQDKTE